MNRLENPQATPERVTPGFGVRLRLALGIVCLVAASALIVYGAGFHKAGVTVETVVKVVAPPPAPFLTARSEELTLAPPLR